MNMQVIFFFYGLAFITMGIVIFIMPKRDDMLNLSGHFWLIGLFGIIHGFNEWVDLLILNDQLFNVHVLKVLGMLLLPVSFLFLVAFGLRVIFINNPGFKYIKHAWFIFILIWSAAYFLSRNFTISGIVARYFICVPGTFLTALGLFLSIRRANKVNLGKTVYLSSLIAVLTFFIYGILSGFIVPQANFLAASVVNYQNFIKITGIPVQFFRMICAIILALSFFGITAIFAYENKEIIFRGGIKRKISLIICIFSSFVVIFTISVAFIIAHSLLRQSLSNERKSMLTALVYAVNDKVNNRIDALRVHLGTQLWEEFASDINLRYASMQPDTVKEYMLEMDAKWIPAGLDSELVTSYLNSPMSLRLKNLEAISSNVVEIFFTDKYGGLIASSGKTSDFYQADEDWWQKSYAEGKGEIFIGDVEMDESSGSISFPLAMPIKDKDNNIVGICKESIDANICFSALQEFQAGKTGYAVLINSEGRAIFYKGIKSLSKKILSKQEIVKIRNDKIEWAVFLENLSSKRKMIITIAQLDNEILNKNGLIWYAGIVQDVDEVFAPFKVLWLGMVVVLIVVLLLAIVLGLMVGDRFAKPIHALHMATEHIMRGDWDYRIEAKTGDEIEQFADTFRDMVVNIKNKQGELIIINKKLEDFTNNLEKKVKERTDELNKINEATLNILQDLTESKEQLEKAMRIKSDFTSMVSHELRTPLGPIKEGVSIILDGLTGEINKEQRDLLTTVKRSADRLNRLVSNVLDFQKLESGMMPFSMEKNDISEVVNEIYNTMELVTKQKGIDLTVELEPGLPKIKFDRDKITQVFTNLVNNAIKFTDKGGIWIKAKKEGNTIHFIVQDTGPGIGKEDFSRIFQSFQQLDLAKAKKVGGTGLGLAISKEIITRHNGKIWVESEVGKGSSFHFLLPIEERRV